MKEMDELEKRIWAEMQNAVDQKDNAAIRAWEPIIEESKTLRGHIEDIEKKKQSMPNPPAGKSAVWSVTRGAIENNYLSLGAAMKAGLVPQSGTIFTVTTTAGDTFKTYAISHRLRERGAIARFYKHAKVKAGDKVEWSEVVPSKEYLLQKK